jgi:hypothetical protein
MHSWSTFGVKKNHEQIRTHKTHHGLVLREATTFPLIVYSMPSHEIGIQMTFCHGTPKVGTFATLGARNFLCKPPIEMRFKAKL